MTQDSWARWVAIARSNSSRSLRLAVSAEDLVTGALIRARDAGVDWHRINDPLVRSFLRFEILATVQRLRVERIVFERLFETTRGARGDFSASSPADAIPVATDGSSRRIVGGLARGLSSSDQDLIRFRARGMTHAEIGRELGLSHACIRQRFSRVARSARYFFGTTHAGGGRPKIAVDVVAAVKSPPSS